MTISVENKNEGELIEDSNLENQLADPNPKKETCLDVTKALVLLGFDSWSSLEPGKCISKDPK